GLGLVALVAASGLATALLASASGSGGRRRQRERRPRRLSGAVRLAAGLGAPPSAVAGVRFALEPGEASTAVPVRSALFGTALAVVIVTATLTFGSGLDTLVSHP